MDADIVFVGNIIRIGNATFLLINLDVAAVIDGIPFVFDMTGELWIIDAVFLTGCDDQCRYVYIPFVNLNKSAVIANDDPEIAGG